MRPTINSDRFDVPSCVKSAWFKYGGELLPDASLVIGKLPRHHLTSTKSPLIFRT